MAAPSSPDFFVFDGQGTPASSAAQTTQIALNDAASPLGNVLLTACHEALLKELSSLTEEELGQAGVSATDFQKPTDLIEHTPERRENPVIANIALCIIQFLRYLSNRDSAPQTHLGVVGFSSGMLPAAAVASSSSISTFLFNAIETFRLAFWIGIRSQLWRLAALADSPKETISSPWSLVIFGVGRESVQAAIDSFTSQHSPSSKLYITAVTNNKCVSVSSRPDILAQFRASGLPSEATTSQTAAIFTLYHATELAESVKSRVLEDVTRRSIAFPKYDDLKYPLRSTLTGENVKPDSSSSLVEEVLDMVLVHPVNWDIMAKAVLSDIASLGKESFRVINVGPGSGLGRVTARALTGASVDVVDWSSAVASGAPKEDIKAPLSGSYDPPRHEPIAIIGMAVNLPGAPDSNALWKVLEDGLNMISEIPKARFDVSQYNSPKPGSKRSMKAKHGNFIDAPDSFDNAFFRISPREARSMDPQQRILLRAAYEAIENAGYVPNATPSFDEDTFGAYVGVATDDYVQNLRNDIDVYYSTGTLRAFLSGRISYVLGISGPSIVVDTACSSSMVAVYQACRALVNRDCNAALAGGVNVIGSPDMYLGLDRAHFLSPTGQCKAFDVSADGYSRAEGCGMFVLKRLSDAVAENDNILGVIRGIDVNQSANAHSITHPHAPTQVQLFHRVLKTTGIDHRLINVVEAHGTGTQAGDPNELESIRSVFARDRTPENPLHITSIKANIGHAEAASGAAGLAKLLLMLRHRTIPAQVSLKNLNPKIVDLDSDNTRIVTTNVPWNPAQEGGLRLAMLNNFGAAGSNTTTLLEEAPAREPSAPVSVPVVVGLSAESDTAIEELRTRYIKFLQDQDDSFSLVDFAYTATARRQLYTQRIAVSAKSKDDLIANLEQARPTQVSGSRGKTLFVFSGQGGQYLGMGATLYDQSEIFRKTVDECHEKLVAWGFPGVLGIIKPAEEGSSGMEILDEFQGFQAAIFVLEYALATLWTSWGIVPDAVAGHSLGEYAALVIAGVIGVDDALSLVATRARYMTERCEPRTAGMMAVNLKSSSALDLIRDVPGHESLTVACYNSGTDCVVAGPIPQLQTFKAHLDAEVGCKSIILDVPYAYHTQAMAPLLDDLTVAAEKVTLSAPTLPIISNVLGSVIQPGDASAFNAQYFSRHCGEPVMFEQGVQQLVSDEAFSQIDSVIEIGPHPTTLPMLKHLTSSPASTKLLPSLRKKTAAWDTLAASLTNLYATRAPLNWRKIFSEISATASCIDLPSYPFADNRFWIQFKEDVAAAPEAVAEQPAAAPVRFSLLGSCKQEPLPEHGNVAIYETPIDQVARLIEGHQVAKFALCPASVYHELALAAAQLTLEQLGAAAPGSVLSLSDVHYINPLVYDASVPRTVTTTISFNGKGDKHDGRFSVASSTSDKPDVSQVHCSGSFDSKSADDLAAKLQLTSSIIDRRKNSVSASYGANAPEVYYTRTIYDVIFSRVVAYSEDYQTMKSITIDISGAEGYSVVTMPPDYDRGTYAVHPVFMDTMLHVAGFVINRTAKANEAYICNEVESVKMLPDLIDYSSTFGVFCSSTFLPDGLVLSDAYAVDTKSGKVVAHLKRMKFRRLRMNGLKNLLASAAQGSGAHAHAAAAPPPRAARFELAQPTSRSTSQSASATAVNSPQNGVPDLPKEIARLVAETCDIPLASIKPDSDLNDLGVDSLMGIEVVGKIRAFLPGLEIDPTVLLECHSLNDLVKEISKIYQPSTPAVAESALKLELPKQIEFSPPVVHAIPAAGGGISLAKLKEVLSSVLDMPASKLRDDDNFERLGLDSLTSIEALHALRGIVSASLPEDLFITCTTIKEVEVAINSL
ncbi:hypothetical protein BOTBODRAFT_34463 [Botryobasidium botryosum FD-172 SS1]|uniref:Polyketide synthase n=1 Tax=Botryobasidium botryosum (strain FD-172 SS1) TaxID=930990 RepID=A0A067MCR2_BOTB1|nr:hypothetical protein BOTBODRAFT_34463 [Botryobasidium botryosum FD-172 SS1]